MGYTEIHRRCYGSVYGLALVLSMGPQHKGTLYWKPASRVVFLLIKTGKGHQGSMSHADFTAM